jgi:hypothetical protein
MNASINHNQRVENHKNVFKAKIVKQTKEIADKLSVKYPELFLSDVGAHPDEDSGWLALHSKVLETILNEK